MADRWGKRGNSDILFSWAPKSLWTVTSALKIRYLLLEREVVIKLDIILKSRDITLPPKVCIVKATVFPVVVYRCMGVRVRS